MARLLVVSVSLLVLLGLLVPVSAVSAGDILSSAAGLFSKSDSLEVKDGGESDDVEDEGESRHNDGQQPNNNHPGSIPTVYTTRTEYIKVTSTKTQIPMCVTAYKPLPQCSKDPYDPYHPYESWRNSRMTASNEISPEADVLEREQQVDEKSIGMPQKEMSGRTGRLIMSPLIGLIMRPLTLPLEMMGLLPGPPPPPPPQMHLHMELSPGFNPLDPNHPLHPNNPLHGANMVNLLNGGLVAAVGLADVIANGGNGGGGGGPGFGGFGPEFGPSGFYNGAYVEVVKEVNTITTYVTKTKGSYTATLTAGQCMPASDTIPHCKPTAAYQNYQAYEPHYNQDIYYGMPGYQYDGYYVDSWSHLRSEPEGASLVDSAIMPSASSVVPESASQLTPPLKPQN